MHGFTIVDGFMEVTDSLGRMIKYLANEPSMGLYYVQQHAHNAIPNVVKLKNQIETRSRETSLTIEDLEDSITMVKTMKDCGCLVADEMVKDIKSSLALISKLKVKKGSTLNKSSGFLRTHSWGPESWSNSATSPHSTPKGATKYFASVFRTAKERAVSFKWPERDTVEASRNLDDTADSTSLGPSSSAVSSPIPLISDSKGNEMLLVTDDLTKENGNKQSGAAKNVIDSETYDDFTADKEAKLVEWLGRV